MAVFVCRNPSQNQSAKTCTVLGFGTISGFDFVNRGLQSDIQPTRAGKVRWNIKTRNPRFDSRHLNCKLVGASNEKAANFDVCGFCFGGGVITQCLPPTGRESVVLSYGQRLE